MTTNKNLIRTMGFAGILGALILFAGDMLFYFDYNSTDLKINMGNVSDLRIKLSGVSALIATWLYLLGLIQVYYAFSISSKSARNMVIISFAGILTAYGVIHGAYVAIATTAKLAVSHNINIIDATALASEANQMLRMLVYPIFALFSFVFIKEVWKKRTLYPRWIILFFPLVPFLFQGLIKKMLSGSMEIIIMGGFLNLILLIFFAASTVALWNKN